MPWSMPIERIGWAIASGLRRCSGVRGELVEGLHRSGHLLAVATGKSRRGLDQSLGESGLAAFSMRHDAPTRRFPSLIRRCSQEILIDLDTHPDAAVVVGDTEYDMQMARNAGVDAVGVSHGVHSTERLVAQGAMECFDDLVQLSGWLYERPGHPEEGA